MITAKEKLQCVERELSYRRRVYARLVARGKMSEPQRIEELRLMEAIRDDYRDLANRRGDPAVHRDPPHRSWSLTMNAEQLARALGAVRSGRQWKCKCASHEDRSPSMIIFDGHTGVVQVRCMAGCEPADIIAVLKSRGLWHSEKLEQISTNSDDRRKVVSRETLSDQREQKMRVLARCVFDEAQPLNGTLAQRYFDSRDLWCVARDIPDIRFHPNCPRAAGAQPAIVIAMRSIASHAVTAVQRIFLTRFARKDCAMMLGTAGGAAMQLQPRGRELNICEGLETGLAIIAQDHAPVWAMGSTSLIQTFPLLDDIKRLVIWADHDRLQTIGGKPCRPGHKAAGICEARWIEADKLVEVRIPKNEGWDQCDVWRSRCGRL